MILKGDDWLSHLFSTEPANRSQAESALRDLYATSGLPAPHYFFWFDSPFKAVLAMMLLTAAKDSFMRNMVAALERISSERKLIDVVGGDDPGCITVRLGGAGSRDRRIPIFGRDALGPNPGQVSPR